VDGQTAWPTDREDDHLADVLLQQAVLDKAIERIEFPKRAQPARLSAPWHTIFLVFTSASV
jgi:hypothetical protein